MLRADACALWPCRASKKTLEINPENGIVQVRRCSSLWLLAAGLEWAAEAVRH